MFPNINENTLINLLHIFLIGPLLLYVGFHRNRTPRDTFTVVLLLGVIVISYHFYQVRQRMQRSPTGPIQSAYDKEQTYDNQSYISEATGVTKETEATGTDESYQGPPDIESEWNEDATNTTNTTNPTNPTNTTNPTNAPDTTDIKEEENMFDDISNLLSLNSTD